MSISADKLMRGGSSRAAKFTGVVSIVVAIASQSASAAVKPNKQDNSLFNGAEFQLRKTIDENDRQALIPFGVSQSVPLNSAPFFVSRSLTKEKLPVVASIGPSLSPDIWRRIHKLEAMRLSSYSAPPPLRYRLPGNQKLPGLRSTLGSRPAQKSKTFELFGHAAIAVPQIAAARRWHKLVRERADRHFVGKCAMSQRLCRSKIFQALKKMRDHALSLPPDQQLQVINRGVNRIIRYRTDWSRHGVIDYWDQLHEVVRKRSGDCEDISMVKYWLLASLGVSQQDMGLLLVRVRSRNADHAVLVVKTDNGQVYLDNRTGSVKRSSQFPDYVPVAIISGTKTWIYGRKVAARAR